MAKTLKVQTELSQKSLLDGIKEAAYQARMEEGKITFKSGESASEIAAKSATAFSEKFAEVFAPILSAEIAKMITETMYIPVYVGAAVSSITPQ